MRLHGVVAAVCIILPETACIPIPARYQEQVTPIVVGTLTLDDGTPAAHYLVAATDDDKDFTCSRPGGRGITDSLGQFHLPETKEWKRIFWLTLMENFGMRGYWVCARPAALGAPGGGPVGVLPRAFVFGHFSGDSVDCLRWSWQDTTRLSCNAAPRWKNYPKPDLQILRGGSWVDGEVRGNYRVLFAYGDRWPLEARGVVQWIAANAGTWNAVRAEKELPTPDSVEFRGASLDQIDGAWRVRVKSQKETKWGNSIWLTFALGRPGVIRELPDSGR